MTDPRSDLQAETGSGASESATPSTPAPGTLDRVRRLVDELDRRSRARADASTGLRGDRDIAGSRHERRSTQEHESIENARLSAVADAQARHRRRVESVTSELDQKVATVRTRREDATERLQERGDENGTEARKKLKEALWLADAVYEASEDKPADEERITVEGIEGRRREIDAATERSATRLGRARLTKPAAADPGIAEPAPAPPDRDGDDGTFDADAVRRANEDLDRAANAAAGIATEIEGTATLRLFFGLMLPALVLVATAAGAGAGAGLSAGAIVGGSLAQAAGIGGGAGAGILLILAGAARFVHVRRTTRWNAGLADASAAGIEAAGRLRTAAAARRTFQEAELIRVRDRDIAKAKSHWEPRIAEIEARLAARLERVERESVEALERIEAARTEMIAEADRVLAEGLGNAETTASRDRSELEAELAGDASESHARFSLGWDRLRAEWNESVARLERERAQLEADDRRLFPAWDHPAWDGWTPPTEFAPSARVGAITVDRDQIPGSRPDHPDFDDPLPATFDLPVTLDFPDRCSMLVRTGPSTRDAGMTLLQGAMTRLLAAVPPGKLRFTLIDPVGLGESFAGFMHLGDHDDALVGGRIWTEPRHIEQRLADLTEHMEHVIQKYLRNAYDSIAEYNAAAGEIAEPYRFLVLADFPSGFNEASTQRLASILSSGPRCGVFTLILADARRPLPVGLDDEALAGAAVVVEERGGTLSLNDPILGAWPLRGETPPPEDTATRLLHEVGHAAKDASRVEVPFDVITPGEEIWTRSSEREIRVPLGKSGATRLQELVLGPGTSQHALIAGKTGSGKSTLLHVLITNLALWYSPDEVRFYLVDFKKGVEFKVYASLDLPHAEAVAVESDREFGLSVLERIDEELRRRGEAYREAGVQDLAGFRAARPGESMPRILLVIDEFQEIFVEDDKIGQEAALLMDRIVRQGRAFGIHVLLGSQTLGGSYSLPRSTLGQMQVRIALQCSESDAYLIMSDDNSAARLLTRPGEAIYNDAGGRVEGNSPFQITWLPDGVRERHLNRLSSQFGADGRRRETPLVVFEGNVPADLAGNRELEDAIAGRPPAVPTAWLGEAIAIKGPTAASFGRRSGANLLVVGQRDEAVAAMAIAAGLGFAAAHGPRDEPGLFVLDGTPPDAPLAGLLESSLSGLRVPAEFPEYRETGPALERVAAMIRDRAGRDASGEPGVLVLVHGLQRFRSLRPSDEFGFSSPDPDAPPAPDRLFAEILEDGPPVGVHVMAWCDTVTNLMRSLPRQGLREFDMRVAFQMGASDSTQFVDTPEATALGLQRALFFSEEAGRLEKFRPWARPDPAWMERTRAALGASSI